MTIHRSPDIRTAPDLYVIDVVDDAADREAIFAVRMIVFVEEQAVPPEEELDAYDVTATHFYVRCLDNADPALPGNGIVATARLLDKGSGNCKIGRVAVLKEYRGLGIGYELMKRIEIHASENRFRQITLEAQCHAIRFYEKLGYAAEGDVFLDAGIEHRLMRLNLM